mmetsp:Transcript_19953/g.48588  ORF Transcript_19953/g.48588 Transcript_19953/m.48588 type:complete len:258 (+) Transcript_19953:1329-2102(+)
MPVPQLHLHILAPDGRQVVHGFELHLYCLLEDPPGVLQVVMLFVEPGEGNPEGGELPDGFLGVHGHDCLRECLNHPLWIILEQPRSLQPLVDVMGILPQQHGGQELLAPGNQMLAPREQEVNFRFVLVLLIALHGGCYQGVLELAVRVEDHGEIMDRGHGHHGLLVDVPGLLELPQADEVVRQGVPESPDLIRKLLQPPANNRFDTQGGDVLGVLGNHITQIHPELVIGLPLHRHEALIVHHVRQQHRSLVIVAHGE